MKLEPFLAERAKEWAELEAMVARVRRRRTGFWLSPTEARELALRYRSAAADLAVARRWFPNTPGTFRLQALVHNAHSVVYGTATSPFTFREFVTTRLWRRVREGGLCLALSAATLVAFAVAGLVWGLLDPTTASGVLPSGFHATTHPGQGGIVGIAIPARAGVAASIFVHNILVSFLTLVGGFTLGALTIYELAYNGLMLGALGGIEARVGGWEDFVRLVAPHGVLELSCIVVAGSAGLQIARALIDPGRLRRDQALQAVGPRLGETVVGAALCLVLAGLVEGIVTTWDLPIGVALALGVSLAGAFWGLVLIRGRAAVLVPAVDAFRPAPAA